MLYTSKTVKIEMITVWFERRHGRRSTAQFCFVIENETTDTANDEQLSISIWFVDSGSPYEKFLAFHVCQSGVSGKWHNKAVWSNGSCSLCYFGVKHTIYLEQSQVNLKLLHLKACIHTVHPTGWIFALWLNAAQFGKLAPCFRLQTLHLVFSVTHPKDSWH